MCYFTLKKVTRLALVANSNHDTLKIEPSFKMKQTETLLYIAILSLVGLFGLWLQNFVLEDTIELEVVEVTQDPDYYIENFTATGLDKNGKRRFVIRAKRMAHFPHDDTQLFDFPHVTQYEEGVAPRHTYADSGWMNSTGDEIIMTDNVKVVVEASADNPGGTINTKRLRLLLVKDEKGSVF